MKKTSATLDDDPLDHEIDLGKARPNPYWLGLVDRRCVRLLTTDLAEAFPDNDSVNEALRTVLRMKAPRKISASTASAPKSKAKKSRA